MLILRLLRIVFISAFNYNTNQRIEQRRKLCPIVTRKNPRQRKKRSFFRILFDRYSILATCLNFILRFCVAGTREAMLDYWSRFIGSLRESEQLEELFRVWSALICIRIKESFFYHDRCFSLSFSRRTNTSFRLGVRSIDPNLKASLEEMHFIQGYLISDHRSISHAH